MYCTKLCFLVVYFLYIVLSYITYNVHVQLPYHLSFVNIGCLGLFCVLDCVMHQCFSLNGYELALLLSQYNSTEYANKRYFATCLYLHVSRKRTYSGYLIIQTPIVRILNYPNVWTSPFFRQQWEKDILVTGILLQEKSKLLYEPRCYNAFFSQYRI